MLAVQRRTRIYPVLFPDPRPEEGPAQRRRGRRHTVARALTMAAVLVVPAVFYVSQRAQAARTGYAILQLRHEVGKLQGENAQLLATTTSLKALDRIERIASKDLGMRRPGAGQLQSIAIAPVAGHPSPLEAQSFWDRLSAWLARSEAEAREPAR